MKDVLKELTKETQGVVSAEFRGDKVVSVLSHTFLHYKDMKTLVTDYSGAIFFFRKHYKLKELNNVIEERLMIELSQLPSSRQISIFSVDYECMNKYNLNTCLRTGYFDTPEKAEESVEFYLKTLNNVLRKKKFFFF